MSVSSREASQPAGATSTGWVIGSSSAPGERRIDAGVFSSSGVAVLTEPRSGTAIRAVAVPVDAASLTVSD